MIPLEGTPYAWSHDGDRVVIDRRPPAYAAPLFCAALVGYLTIVGWMAWARTATRTTRQDDLLLTLAFFGLCSFVAVGFAWLRGFPRRLEVRSGAVAIHARLGRPRELTFDEATVMLAIDDHADRTDVAVEVTLAGLGTRTVAQGRDVEPTGFRALAEALRAVLDS